MKIQRVKLFSKTNLVVLLSSLMLLAFYSILIEYQNYKIFTRFDTVKTDARILSNYKKNSKYVLKLKTKEAIVYTKIKEYIPDYQNKILSIKLFVKYVDFYDYMRGFYAPCTILSIRDNLSTKSRFKNFIDSQHTDKNISTIYQALFTASLLPKDLKQKFSYLGISHLFAISGFHLGILSLFIAFVLKTPYSYLQNRFFPYRSLKKDIFAFSMIILFVYVVFLDAPPSLIRSYGMFAIAFILYEIGFELFSLQTLLLTLLTILAIFPKMFFSLAFWLSIAGVFYIFLFFEIFKNIKKVYKILLLPIWVYITMLPYSLAIFGDFTIYHPLSVIWTLFFSIFYPLSMLAHIITYGDIFDDVLRWLLNFENKPLNVVFEMRWLYLYIFLSLLYAAFLRQRNYSG